MKGLQFEKDVNKLKELKATSPRKRGPEFIKARAALAAKYKVSLRTIQRAMKKEKQTRKPRSDSGQYRTNVTKDAELMVGELIAAGKTKEEAINIVEKKLNQKISTRLANRIEPKFADDKSSMFGEEAKKFIEKIFEYDMIAPEAGIKVRFKNVNFIVDKDHVSDIILALTDAFNRYAEDSSKLPMDRNKYLRSQIFSLLAYQVSCTRLTGSIKDLDAISRMYQRMEIDYGSISPDLKVVIAVCRALKPDITEDEVFSLIKKYGEI